MAKTKTLTKAKLSPEGNIDHIVFLLNQDKIEVEEIEEFLDTLRDQISDMDDNMTDLKDQLKEAEEDRDSLKSELEELQETAEFDLTLGSIQYRADDINDQHLMENFAAAYEAMKPWELGELLKILS